MEIPNFFNKITRAFNQDIGVLLESGDDIFENAVDYLSPMERKELAAFIDRLLDAGQEACEDAWNRSKADVFILSDGGHVRLLREIRARL